ncbi:oligopeptide/dipeptide ABC transporter ATP-binding protein [Janibacter limosus]|uniref:oligopeptide/dipeptide ABC transporter ATP-binding protein n=1 Tax=Janibacter limosus TaxID=53458 RepID=UPI00406A0A55
MITHDPGVVAGLCDEINVLYGGRLVERAERHDLFAEPRHPYTGGLLASVPSLDGERGARLTPVPGSVSDNLPWTSACAFAPRCANAVEHCRERTPDSAVAPGGRALRCFNPLAGDPSPPRARRPGRSDDHRCHDDARADQRHPRRGARRRPRAQGALPHHQGDRLRQGRGPRLRGRRRGPADPTG